MDPQNTFEDLFHRFGGGHLVLRQLECRRHLDGHALYWPATEPFSCGLRRETIYISASPTRGTSFLYKSTNTGKTWTKLTLPGTAAEPSGATVLNVFADPTVSGTVYF